MDRKGFIVAMLVFVIFFSLMASVLVTFTGADSSLRPAIAWKEAYGVGTWNQGPAKAHSLIQTSDGGYAISAIYNGSIFLGKIGALGTMEWNRSYGYGEVAYAVQADDEGYVLAYSISHLNYDYVSLSDIGYCAIVLLKTDPTGNVVWNHSLIEFPYRLPALTVTSIVKASDGGYALSGAITSNESVNSTPDFLLIKANSQGQLEWYNTYGGAGTEEARSVVQTADGGYALAGHTNSYGFYNTNYWLVKTDSTGNLQWAKTYGNDLLGQKSGTHYRSSLQGVFDDIKCNSVVQTSDGGYAMLGYVGQPGHDYAWLVKIGSTGVVQWHRLYGKDEGWTFAYSVTQTGDGGYAIAASDRTNLLNGYYQVIMIKTDRSGQTQWEQRHQNPESTPGDEANLDPVVIMQTDDGALAVLATAMSTYSGWTSYFYLIKTTSFLPAPEPISSSTPPPLAEPAHLFLPTITIEADGSILPSTAPVKRSGNVYAFTANHAGSLLVEKDDVVIDGAGYMLQGNGSITESDGSITFIRYSEAGIFLNNQNNVEIKNLKMASYLSGILFKGTCTHNTIHGNTLLGYMGEGIYAPGPGSSNYFAHNTIIDNRFIMLSRAMRLYNSSNNLISQNVVSNGDGILVNGGSNNTIIQNIVEGSGYYGIELHSSYDYIAGNTVTGRSSGIRVGPANIISYNNLTGNAYGISGALNSTIFENIIMNNSIGIELSDSINNTFYKNNLLNNTEQVAHWSWRMRDHALPHNIWDNEMQGNFWSNYTGIDADADGIGDIPHIIDENNQDSYPLLSPVEISILPLPSPAPIALNSASAPAKIASSDSTSDIMWVIVPIIVIVALLVMVIAKTKMMKIKRYRKEALS